MRKLLFLMLGVVILGFTSCQKDYHNYYTVSNKTIYTNVKSNEWVLYRDADPNKDRTYFTASFDFYESDNFYNEYDGILVYVSYANGIYEQIPQVIGKLSYNYATTNNNLTVFIQNADNSPFPVGTTMSPASFKIVLIPSQE
ncbi:hypothetical protein [Pseudopedobacter beijingensis]|uniref:Lipocalin-like domain-containing protein n=1 Tax=Pseudopedobacter beijingensis TaxID=1207056 RepID=A0ABW4IHP3_9SPHI